MLLGGPCTLHFRLPLRDKEKTHWCTSPLTVGHSGLNRSLIAEDCSRRRSQHREFLSYNPGHDGAIAYLQDAHLVVSIEAEKNSNYRYSPISSHDVFNVLWRT